MKIHMLHSWNVSPREGVAIQRRLAARVQVMPLPDTVRYVAGSDVAYDRSSNMLFAAALVFEYPHMHLIETARAVQMAEFPYIPGLLSFREIPALVKCFARLNVVPDVVLCDGQGIAHPRRFGLACHLGVLVDLPTVGVAKSRLTGKHAELNYKRGSRTNLTDGDDIIGCVLRTRDGVKPLYVSVGHRIDIDSSVRIVLDCFGGYRLPEPTRLADHEVGRMRADS